MQEFLQLYASAVLATLWCRLFHRSEHHGRWREWRRCQWVPFSEPKQPVKQTQTYTIKTQYTYHSLEITVPSGFKITGLEINGVPVPSGDVVVKGGVGIVLGDPSPSPDRGEQSFAE